jgi:gamma-D-glutamyl-L-lysine dipeptidyl-peptidase
MPGIHVRSAGEIPAADTPAVRDSLIIVSGRIPTIRRALCAVTLMMLLTVACGAGARSALRNHSVGSDAPTTAATAGHPLASAPEVAFVNVTLATLWTRPGELRSIDAPSAARPVDIPRWLAGMTTADRAWLVGRIQTQAAYGVQLAVLRHDGDWTKVAVRGQPTPLNRYGYPGWVPTRQLTWNRSLLTLRRTHPVAIVRRKIAWLRSVDTLDKRIPVTYATRLTVLGATGSYDIVATPTGHGLAIAKKVVAVYPSAADIPTPTGRRIVDAGKRFLGLPYLWAGTSAYGFDCSGFMYILFRRFGITLPRDADRQAAHGTAVARTHLRLGDLVFFAGPGGIGLIHHVAMYAGAGLMLEAPHTGAAVRLVPLASMADSYAGARRYL